ncbi:uncharacterized protein TrAtP1_009585 [Trichoderma atroviride]|uniref:uncharacterized protein n=1 Tax=Hypocrea atroviridis TaxID=63577 RepID=UPI003322DA60|nr:hypothetical protein TrAtP1_009585 [Trichoderma atroviride]
MHKRALATALAQNSQPALLCYLSYVRISFNPVRDPPAFERDGNLDRTQSSAHRATALSGSAESRHS